MTIGFLDVGMAARPLYGLAGKPANRIPPYLTDGHHDDKTELTGASVAGVPERSQPEIGTGLISVAKSWFGQGMSELSCRSTALGTGYWGFVVGALAALIALVWATGLSAQGTPAPAPGASGLTVPRFVSLKSDRVNLRQGPGTEYPTAWVFRRAGLPVEVIKEFESWRQVRDAEGTTGWVLGSMLSGRRTAVILPWEVKAGQSQQTLAALRDDDSERAGAVAQVEAGVLASIINCDGNWCRVSVGGFRGYIEQAKLWGAYKDEVIK
jgi:SH3-like domain-containing protein